MRHHTDEGNLPNTGNVTNTSFDIYNNHKISRRLSQVSENTITRRIPHYKCSQTKTVMTLSIETLHLRRH